MESGEVDSSVMSLEDIFDCGEVVERVKGARCAVGSVLAKTGDVPYAYSLVLGRRDDQVFLRMKLGGHDIVGVPSQNRYTVAGCAVPDAYRLVVRTGKLREG